MSEKIKTLQECKDEVAHGDCWTSWHEALDKARKDFLDNIIDRAAELYAQQFKSSPNQLEKEIEELKNNFRRGRKEYATKLDNLYISKFSEQDEKIKQLEQSNTELLETLMSVVQKYDFAFTLSDDEHYNDIIKNHSGVSLNTNQEKK
jgi:hypothetical protein